VCIDGTSNQFGLKVCNTFPNGKSANAYNVFSSFQNSNVVEIYKRIEKSENQLTYYNSGIGTYARKKASWAYLRQTLDNGVDLMVAWCVVVIYYGCLCLWLKGVTCRHLKRRILDAYTWLSTHYQDGDQIYLFGS
jgi:uncharacterized protein (DUF2235 family)